jgi:alkylhydroperoxidase family enzyme
MLRASGQVSGANVDLGLVNGAPASDGGVPRGARLLAFTEAVMRTDDATLVDERARLRAVLSPAAFVDACAVICAFNVVDRVADSTGIPLDDIMLTMSTDVRRELNLARFASAANTPGER